MAMTQEDIVSWVRSLIWSGEYGEEEVALRIKDHLSENEVDEDWLRKVIGSEAESKRKAEATWPKVTDFDRLDRAFTILEAQGIIALHRAGFTLSDGLEDVYHAYEEAGGKNSEYKGFCFYTEQDQQGALDGSGLCIAFGHFSEAVAKGVKVGQILRAALEREGFNVEWDGTIKTRPCVKGFHYQRRSPPDGPR
jgi:hypothetical protein